MYKQRKILSTGITIFIFTVSIPGFNAPSNFPSGSKIDHSINSENTDFGLGEGSFGKIDDTDDDADFDKVICCNTRLVRALRDPQLLKTLSLLADPALTSSLENLKKGNPRPANLASGFEGALGNIPVLGNIPSSSPATPSAETVGRSLAQAIKREGVSVEKSKKMTVDDYDQMGSPKSSGMKRSSTSRTGTPNKKAKTYEAQTPSDPHHLAELKRKCIRECNIALKSYRPQRDDDRVIFYAVGKLGRDMLFAPKPPFAFYKIICDLFPEWEKLTENERINQLMHKLSRFISTNISWTEVRH